MRLIDADKLGNAIAGHSNYSGDSILARIYCMAEGKEIDKPITPLDEEITEKYVADNNVGKWIPVSERLPEDGQTCLVTTKGLLGDTYCEIKTYSNNLYKIDKFEFYDKENVSGFYNYDSECGYYEDADVIAWLPLPEPYKAENKTEQGLTYADQDTLMSAT